MSSNSALKRAARIQKRCIPTVAQALASGEISSRSADVFLRLSPVEQAAELARRLNEVKERERIHAVVAAAIREYLDGLNGGRPDLQKLNQKIKEVLT